MQLKSFGCSFIFGSELGDEAGDTPDEGYKHYSRLTWPAHLAQYLNATYKCFANPGSGNLQILEQILTQSTTKDVDLFVIGWTWIDRFDYYNSEFAGSPWEEWSTIMPVNTNSLAKIYYRDLHSEYRDKFTCLSYIKLAIDTLNQKGIPFIMTYIDNLLFDQRWHTTPAVLDLQEYVKPYMTTFEGQSFLEWSRAQGHPETTNWHPSEAAHRAAGDYMIKVFDKQNIIDPTQ
jgi:hypothetical protein